jgi:hypothetical protein
MLKLRWLRAAQRAFDELDERDRELIMAELETVRLFPNSHSARLTHPFRGSRQFVVRNRWLVAYDVKDDAVWVGTIYGARSKPLEELFS